jgi:hypothetical protein
VGKGPGEGKWNNFDQYMCLLLSSISLFPVACRKVMANMDDSQEISEVVEVKGVYGFMESMLAGRIEDATEEEYRVCLYIPDKEDERTVDVNRSINTRC